MKEVYCTIPMLSEVRDEINMAEFQRNYSRVRYRTDPPLGSPPGTVKFKTRSFEFYTVEPYFLMRAYGVPWIDKLDKRVQYADFERVYDELKRLGEALVRRKCLACRFVPSWHPEDDSDDDPVYQIAYTEHEYNELRKVVWSLRIGEETQDEQVERMTAELRGKREAHSPLNGSVDLEDIRRCVMRQVNPGDGIWLPLTTQQPIHNLGPPIP
jgi:hypothetical protein